MEKKLFEKITFIFVVFLVLFLSYLTIRKILLALFFAFIFAFIFNPISNSLTKKVKNKNLSVIILIFFFFLLTLFPLLLLTPQLYKQTNDLFFKAQEIKFGDILNNLFPSFHLKQESIMQINLQFTKIVTNIFNAFFTQLSSFFINLPSILLYFSVFLFLFFFFLRDFDRIEKELFDLLPLSSEYKSIFLLEFRNITSTIIYGQIFLGILQGILMGLFLYIIKFDSYLFFTVIGIIAGILPLVGPSLVWIPVSLILLSSNKPVMAFLLVIYGLFVSWSIDGFLRPYIVSRKTKLSTMLSFIGIVGGVFSFGILGIIIGPLILSYLLIIIESIKKNKTYKNEI